MPSRQSLETYRPGSLACIRRNSVGSLVATPSGGFWVQPTDTVMFQIGTGLDLLGDATGINPPGVYLCEARVNFQNGTAYASGRRQVAMEFITDFATPTGSGTRIAYAESIGGGGQYFCNLYCAGLVQVGATGIAVRPFTYQTCGQNLNVESVNGQQTEFNITRVAPGS